MNIKPLIHRVRESLDAKRIELADVRALINALETTEPTDPPDDTPMFNLWPMLEPGSKNWFDVERDRLTESGMDNMPSIGSVAVCSTAISAKRAADALEAIAGHLAPVITASPPFDRDVDNPDARPIPHHWIAADDERRNMLPLSTPIEVRYVKGVFPETDTMCLGDAIEWSNVHNAALGPTRTLKSSIASWRPLL